MLVVPVESVEELGDRSQCRGNSAAPLRNLSHILSRFSSWFSSSTYRFSVISNYFSSVFMLIFFLFILFFLFFFCTLYFFCSSSSLLLSQPFRNPSPNPLFLFLLILLLPLLHLYPLLSPTPLLCMFSPTVWLIKKIFHNQNQLLSTIPNNTSFQLANHRQIRINLGWKDSLLHPSYCVWQPETKPELRRLKSPGCTVMSNDPVKFHWAVIALVCGIISAISRYYF